MNNCMKIVKVQMVQRRSRASSAVLEGGTRTIPGSYRKPEKRQNFITVEDKTSLHVNFQVSEVLKLGLGDHSVRIIANKFLHSLREESMR